MDSDVITFKDRIFPAGELELVREVVSSCPGLSRQELANTLCELLSWQRPNGQLKTWECKEFLLKLERRGWIQLPPLQATKAVGTPTRVPPRRYRPPSQPLQGTVREVAPVSLRPVQDPADHCLWRELVSHYHYLGYKVPFGAQLRYLVEVRRPPLVVGCVQLSSPAWKMAVRDRWIGWEEKTRRRNLQKIVNQSRFLLLPWAQIRNLASHVLAQMVRRLPGDWQERFGIDPLLVETLVDPQRYRGTCYRAANWRYLGLTQGRGRMDRHHQRQAACPKQVFVYPLVAGSRQALREG